MLYSVMLRARLGILPMTTKMFHRTLLIATRYAVCRRQFSSIPNTPHLERKLLDYQTHLQTIGSNLAINYALSVAFPLLKAMVL